MENNKSIFNWQLYVGIVLVLAGGVFLADQLLPLNLMQTFWPLLIVLFGLTFLVAMLFAGKRGAGLAIPGTIITALGVLLFVQNTFDLWITWAYAWALLISAVGLGLLIMNSYLNRVGLRRAAGLLIGIGLTLFVIFGMFFEIILNISGTDLYSGLFLGIGLILLGLFVVFSRPLFSRAGKTPQTAKPEGVEMPVDGDVGEPEQTSAADQPVAEVLVEGEAFTRLSFKSVGEVLLTQGAACALTVKGDPEVLDKLQTEVREGELVITYQSDIKDWSGLQWLSGNPKTRYYVTMQTVEALKLGGAGNLEADHLEAEALNLVHNGLGKLKINDLHCQALSAELGGLGEIVLRGAVESQTVELIGAGSYEAEGLESQKAKIVLTGTGSAKVWVESELDATVSGAGSIRYKGNASVTQSNSGVGDIKPL